MGTFGNGASGAAASTHDWNIGVWSSWPMMVAALDVEAATTAAVIAALSTSAMRVHRPLITRLSAVGHDRLTRRPRHG